MGTSLTKNASKTALGTTLSRVLGYVRDMLIANIFGAGMFADAFYMAFRIPNLFRRVFGEGAFSAAFIPVFAEYANTKEKRETQNMLNSVFGVLTLTLLAVSILGIIFSPLLVKLLAWGFAEDPAKMQLTISLTRIMFPFMFFICLAAMLSAALNTLNSFFIPALTPSALSVAEIGFVLSLAPALSPDNAIKGLAISVILGGILHFITQYPSLKNLGYRLRLNFNFKHPAVKRIMFLMIPTVIGLSVDQFNAFVDNICASFLQEGAVTALYYSNRLMQMPLAIFGLALATVSLPTMSKACATGNINEMKQTLSQSVRFSIFILVPCAFGLMAIGLPIIQLLFERGKFTFEASQLTNSALFYYSLGLPAYAAAKIFANAFYAFCDTKTPVKVAYAVMVLHIALCVILMKPMGVGGLALATAVASYVNAAMLAVILRKKIGRLGLKPIIISSAKSFIAASVMAVAAFYTASAFENLFIAVPLGILTGFIIFVFMAYILKSPEFENLARHFKKKNVL